MHITNSQNAVCFEDLKTAALYFDHVIPISFRSFQGRGEGKDSLLHFPEEIPGNALVNLIYGITPTNEGEKWSYLGKFLNSWDALISNISPAINGYTGNYEHVKQAYLLNTTLDDQTSVRDHFKKFAFDIGMHYSTVLLPDESSEISNEYSTLVLAGVPLVDTKSLTWEQIIEFRKDKHSRSSLRNLRLFFYTNYQGKPATYIIDDLGRRLDEYDATRKRLGFETITGSISALIDSKSIQSAAAMGIAAALVGGPIVGITSAALLEFSGMALELAKNRFAIREFERNHDLAYLIKARNVAR